VATYTYYNDEAANYLESKTLENADEYGRIYYHFKKERGVAPDAPALELDGNDYLSVADSADWDFGTGDFTVETWIKPSSSTGGYGIITRGGVSDVGIRRGTDGHLKLNIGGSETINEPWTPVENTWYHIAATRSGTECRLFVNGAQLGATATSSHDISSSNELKIGSYYSSNFSGYMKDVRISDTARYAAAFTPDSGYTSDANTLLLLNLDEAAGSTSWTDSSSSAHTVNSTGDPVQALTPGTDYPDNGRVDKEVLDEADADGAIAYEYIYYPDSSTVQQKNVYGTADITDPRDPVFSDQIKTYSYNENGELLDQYTYYSDTMGWIPRRTLTTTTAERITRGSMLPPRRV
jgi:hypothetical protein